MMKPSALVSTEHVVSTVCPLDCPDSCSLDVTVQDGRVTAIHADNEQPVEFGTLLFELEPVLGPPSV